jgi:hypothetical protein
MTKKNLYQMREDLQAKLVDLQAESEVLASIPIQEGRNPSEAEEQRFKAITDPDGENQVRADGRNS